MRNDSTFSPELWKKHFIPLNAEMWEDNIDGVLGFIDSNSEKYTLIIQYHVENMTFAIVYGFDNPVDRSLNFSFSSVSDTEKMDTFKFSKSGGSMPEGTFISAEATWLVVQDFLVKPKIRSGNTSWINNNLIDWDKGEF